MMNPIKKKIPILEGESKYKCKIVERTKVKVVRYIPYPKKLYLILKNQFPVLKTVCSVVSTESVFCSIPVMKLLLKAL
jgi:hypothetical protein